MKFLQPFVRPFDTASSVSRHCSRFCVRPYARRFALCIRFAIFILLFSGAASSLLVAAQAQKLSQPADRKAVASQMLGLPLHFEPSPDGSLSSRAGRYRVQVGRAGEVRFAGGGREAVGISLAGASPALPKGEQPMPGKSNYLLGNDPALWRHGVAQFEKARVDGVYPGIDLLYYGNGTQLEHDYIVAAHGDPKQIRMLFQGANAEIDHVSGDLVLRTGKSKAAAMRLRRPVAYQLGQDGSRNLVAVSYLSGRDGEVGFALGMYDRARALVIDPVILYSTYFGGALLDYVQDLKVDSAGNIYFLMGTDSSTLPLVGNPGDVCLNGCGPGNTDTAGEVENDYDFYVAKMDSGGQRLDFATYIGGSADDIPSALALDASGNVYISGQTLSSNFPVMNAYQTGLTVQDGTAGRTNTLTKLSPDGSQLLYSSYIGFGLTTDNLGDINSRDTLAVGRNGIAYIAGNATASLVGVNFQSVNPLFKEGKDFVAKFDTTKTGAASLLFASPIGDDANPTAEIDVASIAADSQGDLWLYGRTASATFPVPSQTALQFQCGSPCLNGFLLEINPAGTGVSYGTYMGGTAAPANIGVGVFPLDMTMDAADNIYLLGLTSQTNYPLKNQAFGYGDVPADADGDYGFMTKVATGQIQILYSTLIESGTSGSQNQLYLSSVVGTPNGLAAVSASAGPNGIATKNALPTPTLGQSAQDGVYLAFDTTQSGADSLLAASYLGSSNGFTNPAHIEINAGNELLIGGITSATDFPVVNGFQTTCAGGCSDSDGFLIRIQPVSTFQATPSHLSFPATEVGAKSATMNAVITNGTASAIQTAQPVLSDTKDFIATSDCSTIAAGASCTATFTFAPQTGGELAATYSISDLSNVNQPVVIHLNGNASGEANTATLSPSNIDFGTITVPGSISENAKLTNYGLSSITITSASVTGGGFVLSDNQCGAILAAGASCQFVIEANASTVGTMTGTLTVVDNDGTQTAQLTVIGQAPAVNTLTPGSVNFGNVFLSQTASMAVTYTNNSSSGVTRPTYSINPNAGFSVSGYSCQPVIPANSSCYYTVSFSPTVAQEYDSTFALNDGLKNPSVSLTGTGMSTGTSGVSLLPSVLNFQNVVAGDQDLQEVTFANNTSSVVVIPAGGITFSSNPNNNTYFYGTSRFNDCQPASVEDSTITVPANTSCNLDIQFDSSTTPDVAYVSQLTISYTYSGQSTVHTVYSVITANTVTAANPVVTPATVQFPATANGKISAAQIVTVSNSGETPLPFLGAVITGPLAVDFTATNNCPATLYKNASCQISVIFAPGAYGNEFTANLDIQFSLYGLLIPDTNVPLNGGTSPADFILSSSSGIQFSADPKWVINIAPLSTQIGFNAPITFTVSGLDASYGTPVFTPATVTPGSKTVSTSLTLSNVSAAELKRPLRGPQTALPVLACCVAFFCFRKRLKRYRGRLTLPVALLVFGLVSLLTMSAMSSLTGCASNLPDPVNFTVTATSGEISHTITLIFQPPRVK